ncbi:hypothetical protein DSM3645_29816 [Blastopirellula marina DSM 3645]|uniref:Uncharacterized protein n=1 Tax=Blastopirellula marina DSM 3645 TaxID=314230 RepID=A3ZXJ3_9BACT|nr:hypothetical protein DSM3645_29816 [Blastopirellula marina DSM 3645]
MRHWQTSTSGESFAISSEQAIKIYPFIIIPNTLAMRIGVVIVWKNHAIGGLVLVSS